jgi:hypothetical protein
MKSIIWSLIDERNMEDPQERSVRRLESLSKLLAGAAIALGISVILMLLLYFA